MRIYASPPGHSYHSIMINRGLLENLKSFVRPKRTLTEVGIKSCITRRGTDKQQLERLGKLTSRSLTISTGAPQGCVFSPLLFSFYTNDCTSKDPSVKLLKLADDTTVISLIKDGDESAYRLCLQRLSSWLSGAVLTTWS